MAKRDKDVSEYESCAVQIDTARNHLEVTHDLAFNDFRFVTGAPGVGCGERREIHEPPEPVEVRLGFMHED